MVGNVGNILSPAQQAQLTALRTTARALDRTQMRLATGKNVNSAIDNPQSFFAARALDYRAHDLQRLLDGIGNNIQTLKLAQHALEAIQKILDTAESYLVEYEQDFLAGEIERSEIVGTDFYLQFSGPGDFTGYASGQDSGAPVTITENGFGVTLDNNSWRRHRVNYTVTTNTRLEFDFRSTVMPEIAGIGLDNDTNFANSNDQFFLYGSQTSGISYSAPTPTYAYDGSGEWEHVSIPIGTYFTGNYSHLTFIDDDDGGGNDGDAQWRNIVIHEGDYVYGQTTPTVSDTYEQEYGLILDQIDLLVQDARYRSTNLIAGEDMTTFFNADRSSKLVTEGIAADSDALGLERTDFATIEAVRAKITQVREAQENLRQYAASLALDFNVLNQRNDFTLSMVNILEEGSDALTLTDQNRTGAELLALQTRQAIQVSTLTLDTLSLVDFLI